MGGDEADEAKFEDSSGRETHFKKNLSASPIMPSWKA